MTLLFVFSKSNSAFLRISSSVKVAIFCCYSSRCFILNSRFLFSACRWDSSSTLLSYICSWYLQKYLLPGWLAMETVPPLTRKVRRFHRPRVRWVLHLSPPIAADKLVPRRSLTRRCRPYLCASPFYSFINNTLIMQHEAEPSVPKRVIKLRTPNKVTPQQATASSQPT